MKAPAFRIEGLSPNVPSGTYIRGHEGGFAFGRWWRAVGPDGDHVRFEPLGDRRSREECRAALEAFDKAAEKRSRELNKKRRRERA